MSARPATGKDADSFLAVSHQGHRCFASCAGRLSGTDATSFSDIQHELESRVLRIVSCTVATVDTKGRPRVRILHPVWEGPIAYICTGRHSPKEKHLAKNPFVALSYWDPQHQQVYAECRCQWVDDVAEKTRIWELFKSHPQPYGYYPAMFGNAGPASDDFGVMRCDPWRITLHSMSWTGSLTLSPAVEQFLPPGCSPNCHRSNA